MAFGKTTTVNGFVARVIFLVIGLTLSFFFVVLSPILIPLHFLLKWAGRNGIFEYDGTNFSMVFGKYSFKKRS